MRKELDALRLDDQGNIIDANQREDDTQVGVCSWRRTGHGGLCGTNALPGRHTGGVFWGKHGVGGCWHSGRSG